MMFTSAAQLETLPLGESCGAIVADLEERARSVGNLCASVLQVQQQSGKRHWLNIK